MKTIFKFTVSALLALSLAGCATTTPPASTKVKCPSCGYEFAPFAIGP